MHFALSFFVPVLCSNQTSEGVAVQDDVIAAIGADCVNFEVVKDTEQVINASENFSYLIIRSAIFPLQSTVLEFGESPNGSLLIAPVSVNKSLTTR